MSSAKPIVLASPEYPADGRYGGIGSFFRDLTIGLLELGFDARLIVTEPGPSRKLSAFANTVREPGGGPLHQVTRSAALARAVIKIGPGVVFAPEFGGVAWALTRWPTAPPVITSLATSQRQLDLLSAAVEPSVGDRTRGAIARVLERDQARGSKLLIAPSTAMLRWARELWGSNTPACVVPNLLRYESIRRHATAPPPSWWPERKDPIVLYAGRLEHRKGIDVLARAAVRSWSRGARWHLVVVGADSLVATTTGASLLREAAGHWAESRLHVVGPRAQEELFSAYANAAVAVFPSRWEAFGLVALEAMAAGTTVVATSGSGFEDFIRDGVTGRLVPPDDPERLSDTLDELVGAPSMLAALSKAGREVAAEHDVRSQAARFAALFDLVARGKTLSPEHTEGTASPS